MGLPRLAVPGYWDPRTLAVLVRDVVSGRVVGGMLGRTSLAILFIDLVYLSVGLRGRQIGTHNAANGRGRGGAARLPRCGALHHQFPGTGLLPTAWLAGIWPHSL
jgi:hypothetical protein